MRYRRPIRITVSDLKIVALALFAVLAVGYSVNLAFTAIRWYAEIDRGCPTTPQLRPTLGGP